MIKIIEAKGIEGKQFIENLNKRNAMENDDVVKSVKEIIKNVKQNGDRSLFDYTKRFDGVELSEETIEVKNHEIGEAYSLIDKKLLDIIRKARQISRIFIQSKRKIHGFQQKKGVILGQIIRPLEVIGVYVRAVQHL